MTRILMRPKVLRVGAGLLLYALAIALAYSPVSAEVRTLEREDGVFEQRVYQERCGLALHVVYPIAGTAVWETQNTEAGVCTHHAHIRLNASIFLILLGTVVLFFTLRRRPGAVVHVGPTS